MAHLSLLRRDMPLTVFSCVSYAADYCALRTQDHWTALHFVKALKRTPLHGYALLPLPDWDNVRIDAGAIDRAPAWFARLAVHALPWRDFLPIALVPVPHATCHAGSTEPPLVMRLADELAAALGPDAAAVDLLRWVRPTSRAHSSDGSRDPQVLYGRLRLRTQLWPLAGQRLVLVDDVVASGAHLRAAAAYLRDCGALVLGAICAARACQTGPEGDAWLKPSAITLPDFESDPDWLLPEIYDGIEL